MANTPDCRVASASLFAPAGFSGHPVPSDPSLAALSADELFHRSLDELTAIHRQLQRLDDTLRPAVPLFPPLITGDCLYLWLPELRRFQRALASLEAECGALARKTQTRLDRTRHGTRQLRSLIKHEGVCHGGH